MRKWATRWAAPVNFIWLSNRPIKSANTFTRPMRRAAHSDVLLFVLFLCVNSVSTELVIQIGQQDRSFPARLSSESESQHATGVSPCNEKVPELQFRALPERLQNSSTY